MNKTEVIYAVATKADLTKKQAEAAIKAFGEVVGEALAKKDKVQIVGFGTFEASYRAGRTGRNPQTGEPMEISPSTSVKFKPSKDLKNRVGK